MTLPLHYFLSFYAINVKNTPFNSSLMSNFIQRCQAYEKHEAIRSSEF